MVFTGSANVGRAVMRAASDNLVPVTLELGGKSPAINEVDVFVAAYSDEVCKLYPAGAGSPDYGSIINAHH
jgi:coniferyl-aldehyde dehydrogenase